MLPEAPYALAKLINLTHTPPVDEATGDDIVPVPQPIVYAVSERWRRVWEVWTNAVRSAPSMVKSNLSYSENGGFSSHDSLPATCNAL